MKNKNRVIKLMKEEYERHLLGIISEVSVFDSRGEQVIAKDLKVIHEPSGLEYTIVSVDGRPGNAKITLRTPDQPRETATQPASLHPDLASREVSPGAQFTSEEDTANEDHVDNVDYGIDAHPEFVGGADFSDDVEHETIFVVDEKEFEKNYREA
jgi:hypothetical protein